MSKKDNKRINKREFIKQGIVGSCGLAFCLSGMASIANSFNGKATAPPLNPGKLWKWSKEAIYYVNTPRGTKCRLCPQACVLKEGETGDCKTNLREDGKLFSITYGNPCAVHVDPIEKKPLYHFLPSSRAFSIATAGCNLACLNCQNWEISQSSPYDTRNHDLMPADVIEQCQAYDCRSIAYTYSDPIAFYEYTLDTSKLAKEKNIKNVIISAGYINEEPLRNWCKYIDAANIDLKSFSNETYEMLNAGTLEPVLESLKILKEEGVWLEITNLVVPSWTDDTDMIRKMCDWLYENGFNDVPLHFSRFHPMYKLKNIPATPVETLNMAREIGLSSGLNYVYIGNVPGIGEHTYCPDCGEIVIQRRGFRTSFKNMEKGICGNCGKQIAGVWE
ncbi:MAG: AmmeMemoRadiSam system radical SAM enzyme [Bacteroidales bacterium]|nr:AmmeMemoRadiSam system radical SAM enzyme [Bacteroidales bacterium]